MPVVPNQFIHLNASLRLVSKVTKNPKKIPKKTEKSPKKSVRSMFET